MVRLLILTIGLLFYFSISGQEILFDKSASLEQVYMESSESEGLLPMNNLNIESGYVLYQAELETEIEEVELEFENVRDYAAVYVNYKLQGTLTDSRKKIGLKLVSGKNKLQLYVENIGRITYGPEILDNTKGLFGDATLNGEQIVNWTMTPLDIKNCIIEDLVFDDDIEKNIPGFYKGSFETDALHGCYLNISGWGMGEVWINGKYIGSFWEEEKQLSIQLQSEDLLIGKNDIVVFDLKNNRQKTMKISEKPVFK